MRYNRRLVAVGAIAVVVALAFAGLVARRLLGDTQRTYPVTATFQTAGQLLAPGGDVKLRGILVGRIESVSLNEDGSVTLSLGMDPKQRVPRNVAASIRGKTLFGEKFVALTDEEEPTDQVLRAGDRISEARTEEPFELESVLEAALPLLDAVEPDDLGGALTALARGFSGQEEEVRRSIDNGLIALKTINGRSRELERIFGGLDEFSEDLDGASDSLAATFSNLDALNSSLLARRADLSGALEDVPQWMNELAGIMNSRHGDLVDISLMGVEVLDLVESYRDILPSTVAGLKNFTEAWNTNLSVGCTNANGDSIATAHPPGGEGLKTSTCWQIWQVDGEDNKQPIYTEQTQPRPDSATSAAAYNSQLKTLLTLDFGEEPSDLARLMYGVVRNSQGLIPQELL